MPLPVVAGGFRPPATDSCSAFAERCEQSVSTTFGAAAAVRLGCPALEKILIYPMSIYICVRMRTQSLTALRAWVLAAGVGANTMAVARASSVDSCLAARPEVLTWLIVSTSHLKLSGVRVIRRTHEAHCELTCCGVW